MYITLLTSYTRHASVYKNKDPIRLFLSRKCAQKELKCHINAKPEFVALPVRLSD